MKKSLLVPLLIVLFTTDASAEGFRAPVTGRQPPQRSTPHVTRQRLTGVVPRALRGGNPLQMLNPLAPRRYGTAEESVTYKPGYPGKWDGIKLFEIVWY